MGTCRAAGRASPVRAAALVAALLGAVMPGSALAEPLTLDRALLLAQGASEAIRIKDLEVKKARLAKNEAAARAWPHVDLQASGSYLVSPPTGYTVPTGALGVITIPGVGKIPMPAQDFTIGAQLHDYFSATATLSQPLFTWGKIRNAIDAASLQADAAGVDLLAQRREIRREVQRAYDSALLARESETILRAIAGTAADIVADQQASLDTGTGTREAVLDAQARKAQVDAQLVSATQSRATARETLGMLTGLDPDSIDLASGFRAAMPTLDEQALRARAESASTDLAASRIRQSQAHKKLDIERGGALLHPDLSLGVSLGVTGQEDLPYTSRWDWHNDTWSWDLIISLAVKMSVFDGMESAARIGQAEQDADMAGQALTQQEKLTRLSVRGAVGAALKADADLARKQAEEQHAAERLKNAQASVDNGMGSGAELRAAQILFGSAQLDRLLSQFTRDEALADIERITGDPL